MTVLSKAFLVVDKPPGITSHDVVDAIRAVTGIKKVGHTGTLDPFATGVLPLAIGGATRLIQFLDESIKVYDMTIRLGSATDTGDPTGTVVEERPLPTAGVDQVNQVLRGFIGDRQQVPPAYSAVKHKGRPLYHYARQGLDVEVQARPIKVHDLELISYEPAQLRVRLTCSRGTYARVLAHEIATALASAGHLSALSRLQSGPFLLDGALDFPQLAEIVAPGSGLSWESVLLRRGRGEERVPWRGRDEVQAAIAARAVSPVRALCHLPLCEVRAGDVGRLQRGVGPVPAPDGVAVGERYLIVCGDDPVAIAERSARGPQVVRSLSDDGGRARA